ncbi:MAG: ASKHA domain-containing protein [Sulfolobales archaeon]|nr:ASKHA domain-containing protein [Sulfolobales archaeon]MCX8198424.1 ASKHA domain-containing protein [Sulfolobales archaeon]MDW8169498.1 ASKHA domain-containing protein [Desulfurococcaceae archaeon]
MVLVTIEPYGSRVEVCEGSTLLHAIRLAGLSITSLCGGFGSCGKCRVIVISGSSKLSELSQLEVKHLRDSEIRAGYRLSCQVRAFNDVTLYIPVESRVRVGERRAVTRGFMRKVEVKPLVKKIRVQLPPPSLRDQRSDLDRLIDSLKTVVEESKVEVDYEVLKNLPTILRGSNWDVASVLWGREIVSIEPGDAFSESYGVAIDVGTSKIVVHLIDLTTGEVRAVGLAENPQLAYGEDIVSRMTFANISEDNLRTLQLLLINSINELVESVCRQAGVSINRVYEIVVVGNTAMHHFLLGLKTKYLSASPFTPVVGRTISFKARDLGVKSSTGAIVTFLPVIAGFVGADAVADALATGILSREDNVVLLDVGTNTEIFVGNSERMLVCSAPSGPALEGAHIRHGMKAVDGAIEEVSISSDGEVEYRVIGDAKPRGICGSAIIDIVAELYRNNFIDSRGKFRRSYGLKRLRKSVNGWEYVIAWSNETSIGKDIVVSEKDISEVMLAKAAIYAGISVLLRRRGLSERDISEIIVAGSFGTHINPLSARIIGIIPDVPGDKVKFVGNTAIMGADMVLLSIDARSEAEKVARTIEYVELSADPYFSEEFSSALLIPHKDVEKFTLVKALLNQ